MEFNRKDKTWARAGAVGAAAGLARAGSDAAHVETGETFDTTETPQTNTAGQEVSSLTSINCLNRRCSTGGELLADHGVMSSEGPKEEGAQGVDHAQSLPPSNQRS